MKVKKVSKPTLEGDTYLVAQAVNHNAEVLEKVLNRLEKLEEWVSEDEPIENDEFDGTSENKECRGCYYNDGEVHAECIFCDTAADEDMAKKNVIAEIDRQGEWLAEAGYSAYNVDIAFESIIRALRKWLR